DLLVSTTPASTTVGGLSGAASWWQNNVNGPINVSSDPAVLITEMEETWRDCTRYGKKSAPDKILCGGDFYDAYRDAVNATNQRQVVIREGGTGGPKIDGATSDLYFKGVLVEYDPTFDEIDSMFGPVSPAWSKRCYFLNSKTIKLRPLPGHWMVNRKPNRMYDRYVYYFAMTSKYRLTINKRNANAVLWIA